MYIYICIYVCMCVYVCAWVYVHMLIFQWTSVICVLYIHMWLALNQHSISSEWTSLWPQIGGRDLNTILSPGNFNIPKRIITISGASLDTLTSEATCIVNTHPTPHKIHTYFIAGIPDITSKVNDVGYEEVIFIDNAETAHHNFMTK